MCFGTRDEKSTGPQAAAPAGESRERVFRGLLDKMGNYIHELH